MSEFTHLNYLNLGPHGTFQQSGMLQTTPADVDALFQHLAQPGVNKLVVHFHGGLVREQAGLGVAEKMWDLFKDDAHPVTFVWETGLLETLRTHLTTLYETKLFQKIIKYVIRQAAKRLGGGIGAKGPGQSMTLDEIQAELASLDRFDRFDAGARGAATRLHEDDIDAALHDDIEVELEEDLNADPEIDRILAEQDLPDTGLLDKDFAADAQNAQAKGIVSTAALAKKMATIVRRVLKRYVKKRDHGFYPTVVEETLRELYLADFGAWVWGRMKETAETMWTPNAGPVTADSYAGRYFLDKLAALQQAKPDLAIDLVGHSAGSIAICQFLRAAAQHHPGLKIRNIVFLAPACTMTLLNAEIIRKPQRYQRFRMFTMRDALETQDRLVPLVYTRSLLYFISGVLEGEADHLLAGLELHSRGDKPYTDEESIMARQFLYAADEQRLVLSETINAGLGLNSTSAAHGDFDDDPVTRASLLHMIQA